MSGHKYAYRWSQLLRPEPQEITPELQARFDKGNEIHERTQAMFPPHWVKECTGTYSEEDLPCDIIWHADLYNPRNQTVYEIKPYAWGEDEEAYCLAQLSGYYHFLNAKRAKFILYQLGADGTLYLLGERQIEPIPWPILRTLANSGYERLRKDESKNIRPNG